MAISIPQRRSPNNARRRWSRALTNGIKTGVDRTLAAIALIVLSPLMVGVAIAVYFKLGTPIFFTQPRPGQHGKVFTFYKFRSMTDARDTHGNLLDDGQRLPAFGQWLRSTSLDELPQLWNVLKGDMSLVGPRPLLVEYLDYYSPRQARRHAVKPGITGWAQVNGRHALSWADKCELDVWYVEHHSLALDLKILALTIAKVLRRRDIGTPGCNAQSAEQIAAIKRAKQLP